MGLERTDFRHLREHNSLEALFQMPLVLHCGAKSHFVQSLVRLHVEGEAVAKGNGFSKKKAEQDAAQKSCVKLHIE